MKLFKCAECESGTMWPKEYELLKTIFEGVAIQVPDAFIYECSHCQVREWGQKTLQRCQLIKESVVQANTLKQYCHQLLSIIDNNLDPGVLVLVNDDWTQIRYLTDMVKKALQDI